MIRIVDDFCSEIDSVRESALRAGFGNWDPDDGYGFSGIGFWGDHAPMVQSLARSFGGPVYPNGMFFRLTSNDSGSVHTDKDLGHFSCVAYLSSHEEGVSGTAFYRHRETGYRQMPTLGDTPEERSLESRLVEDMRSEDRWEELDFVRGLYNRAVIFPAARFHARRFRRYPKSENSVSEEEGRMVWTCHFHVPEHLRRAARDEVPGQLAE